MVDKISYGSNTGIGVKSDEKPIITVDGSELIAAPITDSYGPSSPLIKSVFTKLTDKRTEDWNLSEMGPVDPVQQLYEPLARLIELDAELTAGMTRLAEAQVHHKVTKVLDNELTDKYTSDFTPDFSTVNYASASITTNGESIYTTYIGSNEILHIDGEEVNNSKLYQYGAVAAPGDFSSDFSDDYYVSGNGEDLEYPVTELVVSTYGPNAIVRSVDYTHVLNEPTWITTIISYYPTVSLNTGFTIGSKSDELTLRVCTC